MLGLILAYSDSNKIPLYLPSCYYLPLAGGAFADKTVCARAPSLRAVEERAHPAGSGPTGLRQPRARWEAREVAPALPRFAVAKTSSAEPRRRRRARPPTHRPGLDARPPTPPLEAAWAQQAHRRTRAQRTSRRCSPLCARGPDVSTCALDNGVYGAFASCSVQSMYIR